MVTPGLKTGRGLKHSPLRRLLPRLPVTPGLKTGHGLKHVGIAISQQNNP